MAILKIDNLEMRFELRDSVVHALRGICRLGLSPNRQFVQIRQRRNVILQRSRTYEPLA